MNHYNKALAIRLTSYIASNFSGVIAPMLIYYLTNSLVASGSVLIIEWTIKLGLYFYGGAIIEKYGTRKVMVLSELARTLAMILFFVIFWFKLPWYLIAIGTTGQQAANAFSNLIFDANAQKWSGNSGAAFSLQTKTDVFAGVIAMALCLICKDLFWICVGGMAIQFITMAIITRHQHILLENSTYTRSTREWFNENKLAPLSSAKGLTTPLWIVGFISFCASAPHALAMTQIPFLLEYAFDAKTHVFDMSLLLLLRQAVAQVGMEVMVFHAKRDTSFELRSIFVQYGMLLLIIAGLLTLKGYAFVAMLILLGILRYSLSISIKRIRNHYMDSTMNRYKVVGFLIALEVTSFLFVAALLAIGISLYATIAIVTGLAAFGVLFGVMLLAKREKVGVIHYVQKLAMA